MKQAEERSFGDERQVDGRGPVGSVIGSSGAAEDGHLTAGAKRGLRPKILIIGPVPPPYHGVAVSTRLILESPQLSRFELIHIDTSDRRDVRNIGRLDLWNVWLAIVHGWRLLRTLRRERPSIVYLTLSQGLFGFLRDAIFLLLGGAFRVKTIVHLRGSSYRAAYDGAPGWLRLFIRKAISRVSHFVVLGESLRRMCEGLVSQDRVTVIPNGTADFVGAGELAGRNGSEGGLQLLFLGTLKASKGLFVTLRAFRDVIDRVGVAKLACVGDWGSSGDKEETMSLVRSLGLEPYVGFPGVLSGEQKERYLLDSDVLVFPSYDEGHPRVVLEGMAAGCPIVTTNCGAIAETVIDGETGFVVEVGDVKAVADRLCQLVENPLLRQMMGQKARERFLELYTAERANRKLAELFEAVLREPRPGE